MVPKSPKLFSIFKIKHCLIYLTIITVTLVPFFEIGLALVGWWFCFLALESFWIASQGHGVYNQKKLFGMPAISAVGVSVMIFCLVAMIAISGNITQGFSENGHRLKLLCYGGLAGIFLAVLRWYHTAQYVTFHGSSINLREILKQRGRMTDSEIETRIRYLEKEGWLSNKAECC